MRSRLRRPIALLSVAAAVLVVSASPAAACGGLVGENGTIRLGKTTTLAAWHDGIERYVTSFEFSGEGEELGSIIPLPGVPTDVTRGGDWTLQRLEQEVAVAERFALDAAAPTSGSSSKAEVLLETTIDALDITIHKGGGADVGQWAAEHGFLLTPDAPEVLDFYSQRSPIFMAARFDANAARELGQQSGDGTPIMLTIPVDQPWVPLRILGLGLGDDERVNADVFMLTDRRPQILAGDSGLQLVRSEAASTSLLDDLRSDVGMDWVPSSMWFSYLTVNASAGELHYDLASSVRPFHTPALKDTGLASPLDGVDLDVGGSISGRTVPFEAIVLATVALGAIAVGARRRLLSVTR
jgi:hypothetical protein